MAAADQGLARVGARVQVLTHRATVRYIGPVAGQEGVWVGLEYDDPSRGKHDGVAGGVRYFTTVRGPTAGSFVRLEKVDFGSSVLQALAARYNNERGELGDVAAEELYVHTASNRRVHIQVVGVEMIKNLQSETHRLLSARLVGAGVSHVGDQASLCAAASNMVELDLTGNLVADWEAFVPPLCAALPTLQVLNLSDNLLQLPCGPPQPDHSGQGLQGVLPGLRGLVLNDCSVTWEQVLVLQQRLPNLQELHLAGNRITSMTASPSAPAESATAEGQAGGGAEPPLQALQVLSLDDNQLQDWQAVVQALGRLPALRVLSLSNNPLASPLTLPSQPQQQRDVQDQQQGQPQEGMFARLESLHIASCQCSAWSDVDALNQLPTLHDLRISGNPVLQHAKSGGRYEVIGRIARLTMLNGSAVSARERQDAEIRYLQNIVSSGVPPSEVAALHPRCPELVRRHGQVLSTAAKQAGSSSLGDTLLSVRLTCVAAAPSAKMGSHEKRLPRGTQLRALRLLCEQLFKVKVAGQLLFLKTPGDPVPQDITQEEDTTPLTTLGVQDGYEVLVDQSS